MENSKFIKVGEVVNFKPNIEGLNYDLEANKVYTIQVDPWTDAISLKLGKDLNMPAKVYELEDSSKFINKILKRFELSQNEITGVMLSGLKGSGKTILAKQIALKSNLPIILMDKAFSSKLLKKLFSSLSETPVCFLFDEIDKISDYDEDYLLKVLDGVDTVGKHLIVFTCNDKNKISEYMTDRCSRIRYWKQFEETNCNITQYVLEDKLEDKTKVNEVKEFIHNNFGCVSFDNICAFAQEINENPDESIESLFKDMNLSTK